MNHPVGRGVHRRTSIFDLLQEATCTAACAADRSRTHTLSTSDIYPKSLTTGGATYLFAQGHPDLARTRPVKRASIQATAGMHISARCHSEMPVTTTTLTASSCLPHLLNRYPPVLCKMRSCKSTRCKPHSHSRSHQALQDRLRFGTVNHREEREFRSPYASI